MLAKGLEKVLNIYRPEFARTRYAWIIRALFKAGLVIGWTTVISLFVDRFSISALPVLFLAQAALTVSGMLLFSFVIDKYEPRWLVIGCAFSAAILLFAATLFQGQSLIFFPLVLAASGIFLPQISIFLSNYIEDFFTPSECVRTFPVIESAETIAGILGGLLLAGRFAMFDGYKLIYVWILLIFAFVVALFVFQPKSTGFYNSLYEMKILPPVRRLTWSSLTKGIVEITRIPFLQILIVVVFAQWLTTYLLEFQYTKIIDQSLPGGAGGHAESLSQGLGALQIIFNGSALVVQLLLTSRILGFLGTFGGFLFQSFLNLMSSISMLMGFGYFTTVLAKNNFEVATIVSKNAYEASFYAFRHGTQKGLREFFEGLVAPIGTIVGMLVLLAVRMFFVESDSLLAVNVLLVLCPAFVLAISFHMQRGYTAMVRRNLVNSGKKISKLHAIEILAQKGHGNSADILVSMLKTEDDADINAKIMNALKLIGDRQAIPAIEDCIRHVNPCIAVKAINTLADFPGIRKKRENLIFTRQKLVGDLKKLFKEKADIDIKTSVLRALSILDDNGAIFILDVLKNAEPRLKAECIRYMSSFRDPAVSSYLRPYLSHSDAGVKARAAAGMLRINPRDDEARETIKDLCCSESKSDLMAVFPVLCEIGDKKDLAILQKHLSDGDPEIRLYAAAALVNHGRYEAAEILADLLLEENALIFGTAKTVLRDLKTGAKKVVAEHMQRLMLRKAGVEPGKKLTQESVFRMMEEGMLKKLKKAYVALDAREEAELMRTILEYKESLREKIEAEPSFATAKEYL